MKRLFRNRKGQLADLSSDIVAIIFFFFILLLMYGIFSLSKLGDLTLYSGAGDTLNAPTSTLQGTTALYTYLRTPIPPELASMISLSAPDNQGIPGFEPDLSTAAFLAKNPGLWKGRTYGEFLSRLLTVYGSEPAYLVPAFSSVTVTLFKEMAPTVKEITIELEGAEPIRVIFWNEGQISVGTGPSTSQVRVMRSGITPTSNTGINPIFETQAPIATVGPKARVILIGGSGQ